MFRIIGSLKFMFSKKATKIDEMANARNIHDNLSSSVNSVVEFPGAGLGRLITINSELNGAI